MRTRLPTYVRGFDEELGGGVPKGQVVLIRGPTGTMKSSFAYSVLYHNAKRDGRKGLYVTLEQDAVSLLGQMVSLGLRPSDVSETLPILDVSRGRDYFEALSQKMRDLQEGGSAGAMTAVFRAKVEQLRSDLGFELLAIDSWDALELSLNFEDRRRDTFHLMEWFRGLGCTTFLVTEVPEGGGDEGLEEEFLADAVFHLRLERVTDTAFQRRIRCSKMRAANHSSDFFTLVCDGGGFEVTKAIA